MAPLAIFLLSLLILLQQNQCKQPEVHNQLDPVEKKALLDFIGSLNYFKKVTWKDTEPPCSWKGVTCGLENTTVMYLQLPGKTLVGVIPPNTIGKLKSLRVLSLRFNGLYGNIPSDFSNLTSLTRLSLNNNNFTGTIPPDFSNFKKFVRFRLEVNNFTGQLPFLDSKHLRNFNVSFNKLNSSIPDSVSEFKISAFSANVFLCGKPTNNICNYPYLTKPPDKKENHMKGAIIGISVGSGILMLILLCYVRKRIYQRPKELPVGSRRLKFLGDDRVCDFDLEDLLKSSAEILGKEREKESFGMSYKQVLKEKTVVVKRLKDVVVMVEEFRAEEEFRATMAALEKVKHENVVPLIAYYYSKYEKMLVYDYMPAGSLYDHLHGKSVSRRRQLDWNHRMKIALSAAKGLKYLHVAAKVVHGNIKSSNILFKNETDDVSACLSDYGLNTLFDESSPLNRHVTGYRAPEVLMDQKVESESDVYSFGALLLELLRGKNPKEDEFCKLVKFVVQEEPKDEIFDVELRRNVHKLEEMMHLLQIAKDCLSDMPKRPKMEDVLSRMERMWLTPSSDEHSKGYDYTPSTESRDTPSTITP